VKSVDGAIRNGAIALCALLLAMDAAPALAEGPYVGAGIGGFDAAKVFAGYEPGNRLALELAYERTSDPLSVIFAGSKREYRGVQASVLGFLPVGRNSLYGRVGSFSWDAEDSGKKVDSGTDLAVGIGYQFGSIDTWRLRIELEHFGDIGGFLTASVGYRFGAAR
jgi:Outer membrane protein beta-barrel domain